MTNRSGQTARLLFASLLVLSALGTAACGSSAASPAASASSAPSAAAPSATPEPTASPTAAPTASPTAEPTAAPTEAPSASAATSVKVDLPSGWQEVQMTAAALEAQIKAIKATNAQQATALQQILDSGAFKNFLFYALRFDGTKNNGNLNVTLVQSGGMSLDAAQPLIEGEFKQLGAKDIVFGKATIGGVEALKIDYTFALNGASGTAIPMVGRGYFIPHGDALVNITTTCYGTTTAACIKDGDKIANGMVINP